MNATERPTQPAQETIAIERLAAPASDADVAALARLLVDAVESGAAVSFMAPLERDVAERWWRGVLETLDTRSVVLVARDAQEVVGTVQLHAAWAPNQPHRGDVAKLIVHRRARGRGIAARLMQRLEEEAHRAGLRLLTLDTKRGEAAEFLYRKLGWIECGVIPDYAVDPDGRALHDTVVFYKPLHPGG